MNNTETAPLSATPKAAAQKASLPTIEASKNPPPVLLPSIEQRLEKFADLKRLAERRLQVTEALEDLEDFHIGTTGGASITLLDSRGTTKKISHPIVVADMVQSAKTKLAVELANIDSQFLL